jgi:hypothetical protein
MASCQKEKSVYTFILKRAVSFGAVTTEVFIYYPPPHNRKLLMAAKTIIILSL